MTHSDVRRQHCVTADAIADAGRDRSAKIVKRPVAHAARRCAGLSPRPPPLESRHTGPDGVVDGASVMRASLVTAYALMLPASINANGCDSPKYTGHMS